jgi:hypothetical protein
VWDELSAGLRAQKLSSHLLSVSFACVSFGSVTSPDGSHGLSTVKCSGSHAVSDTASLVLLFDELLPTSTSGLFFGLQAVPATTSDVRGEAKEPARFCGERPNQTPVTDLNDLQGSEN